MFEDALYPKTKQVLETLSKTKLLNNFYLAGGTALALQLGHRKSIDLDFFSDHFPGNDLLINNLTGFTPKVIQEVEGTLDVVIEDVKVSFLEYNYPLLEPLVDYEGVKLAGVLDIACMKVSAISSRGSRKDFVDLYKIFEKYPLREVLASFEEKFQGVEYQTLHILKSLVYFDDAQQDPEPDYLAEIKWADVKRGVSREVEKVLKG